MNPGLTYEEARNLSAEELEELGHGKLWTTEEAERKLGLCKGQVNVWRKRGYIEAAVVVARIRYYWSNDLIDCKEVSRRQHTRGEKDTGRFQQRELHQRNLPGVR